MLTTSPILAQEVKKTNFSWSELPCIPDHIGFAGSFAGVSNGALVVAGGANFPDGGAPWTGSVKVWSDKIFVLEKKTARWKNAGKLPSALGYGGSVNYKNQMIIIGGSNKDGHMTGVWSLDFKKGKINFKGLPSLPGPIANTAAAVVGNILYVAGGTEAPSSKTTSSNFWAMDLSAETKEWKILETWPGASRMLAVAGSLNGCFYIISGVELINGERKYLNDAYCYDSKSGWKKIADLPSSVAAAPSPAYAHNGYLHIFGGDDGILAPQAATLKEKHPGFFKGILLYEQKNNKWINAGEIFTLKKEDAESQPNKSIWAPVTTTLTVWDNAVVLPGGEVRPATRTPKVLMARPNN